ncbi:DUF6898 family protein [Methylobrevis albus]|uniref:DUF6898 domain-containing protein n=1 Tax=Methylobrevis albus TaxID=2793297 RepID=A0A931I499_9HYPH|nr:hypothetical protein [Methylobrevis albus]MBH0239987.1 hypothetical protein [Methylobrevis albus]
MAGTGGDVYFEFVVVGRQVKVTAIDAASGLEAVVLGPAATPQSDLQRLALRKLEMRRQREGKV